MPSITDSIGRVLGGRYRLVTPLGTGASAHVYLADDVSLHRRVAIKVLHPALAGDTSFLKRFRAEARAAAALSHPHVLQVYDWGEEDGEPYLVLEFLAGGSLRQLLDAGTLLSPSQAVEVGIEATAGLDYAHRRGVVHRDIKPANLLFDADRRLRIADFGLARALAEASWTEPEGTILGTARYAAPEQVEGMVLDGKADVYALALVLYESVTGEAPFIGDTTVATLMARVGTLLPDHPSLGPLDDVLVWAAAPDPAERYDASQFGQRLQALAIALPPPAPLPLVGTGSASGGDDREGVRTAGFRPFSLDNDPTELGVPAVLAAGATTAAAGTGATGSAPTRVLPAAFAPSGALKSDTTEDRRPPRRWPWVVLAVVAVAALIAAGIDAAVRHGFFTPSHTVPSLVGKTLPQAERAARPDRFLVRVTGHRNSVAVAAGLVLSQHPAPRARDKGATVTAKQGSTIDVVLSSGPPLVTIPPLSSVVGCVQAVQTLAAVHLVGVCPGSAAQYSSTVVAGAIIATSPSGTAPYGSTVTIIASKGHAPVAVPPVSGTDAQAAATLTADGFVPAQQTEYDDGVPAGQVIGTDPAPSSGPQPFGSTVTVIVSLGPKPVAVPNLVGQSVAAATSTLQALGLQVGGPYGPPGAGHILSTDPVAGTTVRPGTVVDLYTY